MRSFALFILLFTLTVFAADVSAQTGKKELSATTLLPVKNDSAIRKPVATDTPVVKKDTIPKHIPRIATRRSAILPGWGQAYNREYWKIPIIYGILAIPVGFYFYNNSYYKKTKFAYEAKFKAAALIPDSSDLSSIDPELVNLSISSLQNYRNSFRQSRDYSLLWFLLAWGLQVADATVFAHLKQFDVSDDLSMEINPLFNPHTRTPGLTLAINLKPPVRKTPVSR